MAELIPSIGLEIHAELSTESKLYCSCPNAFGGEPNTRVCPVCMGFPGTLPVLNRKAVDYAVKMGHALNCRINAVSRQDRKNYFYPDLPKAYQISQADKPICESGWLEIMTAQGKKRFGITRIHIEEDAGKLVHDAVSGETLADLNRCGVPLIEIVTEPDMHSSADVRGLLEAVRSILRAVDISDCRMEEGSIRCDVNVSLAEPGSPLGTRCEMKNINSFSGAVRAVEYEINRQKKLLDSGKTVRQETRRWDDIKGESYVMRTKENAEDYRFFPEPDLPPIILEQEHIDILRSAQPELPTKKLLRYVEADGLPLAEAQLIAYDEEKDDFYDKCSALGLCSRRSICNWLVGEISRRINITGETLKAMKITPQSVAELSAETESGHISSSAAKQVFEVLAAEGGSPAEIIKRLGLAQITDENYLYSIIMQVISENERSVSDYKNGREKALGHLVGQCMKLSDGKADPALTRQLLIEKLSGEE